MDILYERVDVLLTDFSLIDLMVEFDIGIERDTILITDSRSRPLIQENIENTKIESAFNLCCGCYYESAKMSSIPQGIFCAKKVRENEEKLILARVSNGEGYNSHKYFNTKLMELSPLKYNSKLMNSIWGLYNRYSPHNIKRTNDDLANVFGGLQESSSSFSRQAAPKEAATNTGKVAGKPQPQNLPKIEKIWSNGIPISQSH